MRAESEIARAGAAQEASKAEARSRRISKDETHQTQPEPTLVRGSAIRLSAVQERCAVQTAPERIGMAVCPDVICNKGEFVLVIRIGDLPMGSGTLGLQCCRKRFYPLPDHIRTNGSSSNPTDQALKKPLKFEILV